MRTRDELLRLLEAHTAAVAALKAELNSRMLDAFKQGSADTWRLSIGTASASVSHDGHLITDPDAFYRWLANERPDAVKVHTVTIYEPWNRKWVLEDFLPTLHPVDPEELKPGGSTQLCSDDGALVPGVIFTKGGRFLHASWKPKDETRRLMSLAAEAYAAGGSMPELES